MDLLGPLEFVSTSVSWERALLRRSGWPQSRQGALGTGGLLLLSFHIMLGVLLQERQRRLWPAALQESGHSQSGAFPHQLGLTEQTPGLSLTDSGAG